MANFKHMHSRKRAALLAALVFVLPLTAPAQERSISIAEVFHLVQTRNPGVLAGEEGVEASRQSMRQARSALLPQLSAQASQGRGRSMADFGPGSLNPVTANSFSSSLMLSVPIVDATNIAMYKAAKLETSAARFQQQSDLQDAYAQAASMFFLYQRHLSAVRVIESTIDLDNVLLDIAAKRREADVATELDLTRAKVALSKDRQRLLAEQTVLDQSRLQLLQTIGLDPELKISLVLVEPLPPDTLFVPDWHSVLESRPEYKAANELLQRNKVAERAADWQRFPSMAVQGQYGHTSRLPGDGEGGEVWAIGLTMNVPLWEGGRIGAEKMQARALIRQQEQRIRQISDSVHTAYNLALEAVRQRWEEIPLAREAVSLGELELKYARERFEANVTDNSDVISAQLSLADANDTLVDALLRYDLARVDLARVLGQVESRLTR
ncbi:MAG: TolC family protein [Opitutales bacterium]|jgi:outer membrane protein TolC